MQILRYLGVFGMDAKGMAYCIGTFWVKGLSKLFAELAHHGVIRT